MPTSSRSNGIAAVAAAVLTAMLTVSAAGDSPLVSAIRHRDAKAVQAALKQGANPNTPQGDGTTPLFWAAQVDDPAIADLLIRAGALYPSAKVVVVGPASRGLEEEARALGAGAYLARPCAPETAMSMVHALLFSLAPFIIPPDAQGASLR